MPSWPLLSIPTGGVAGVRVTSTSPRRIRAADSKTRAELVDAAEQPLVEEGYAAVTSRRVGAKAGLKPQLVHYYFRTMDDLFVEMFRHPSRGLQRGPRCVPSPSTIRMPARAKRWPQAWRSCGQPRRTIGDVSSCWPIRTGAPWCSPRCGPWCRRKAHRRELRRVGWSRVERTLRHVLEYETLRPIDDDREEAAPTHVVNRCPAARSAWRRHLATRHATLSRR